MLRALISEQKIVLSKNCIIAPSLLSLWVADFFYTLHQYTQLTENKDLLNPVVCMLFSRVKWVVRGFMLFVHLQEVANFRTQRKGIKDL